MAYVAHIAAIPPAKAGFSRHRATCAYATVIGGPAVLCSLLNNSLCGSRLQVEHELGCLVQGGWNLTRWVADRCECQLVAFAFDYYIDRE
jgi:hypothetical protein